MITSDGRFLVSKGKQSKFTEDEATKLRDELREKARGEKKAFYIRELKAET